MWQIFFCNLTVCTAQLARADLDRRCVDDFYISKKVKHITALELNPDTALLSSFNMSNLAKNITVLNQDCNDFINSTNQTFDSVFIDPARRGDNNKRLFGLVDCQPNIIELIPAI